jgi:hypothetical protein
MHLDNLHWILVEDGPRRVESVERILERSKIAHTYLVNGTEPGYPGRGWPQRNYALDYIRQEYANHRGDAVIYFADDDNSYDLRLFHDFLPKVRTIGLWAVGQLIGEGNSLEEKQFVILNVLVKVWSGMDTLRHRMSKIPQLLDGMRGGRRSKLNSALTWPDSASIWI